MSKERAKNRAAREHEAATRTAAKGHEHDRQERLLSMKSDGQATVGEAITQPQHHKTPKPGAKPISKAGGARTTGTKTATTKNGSKGRPTPKQSAPRSPANKKRAHAPVGRPDGPLARRRRFRVRLLLIVLLVVNIAVGVIVRDWAVSLAVLIGSAILAPLLAAALLRRK
ncbi:MAG TPA: hypothetical protein VFR87_13915 [Nocardioidaceae bacterium]|nr:hypothetical protein [Nocardioidaceae bacterium]